MNNNLIDNCFETESYILPEVIENYLLLSRIIYINGIIDSKVSKYVCSMLKFFSYSNDPVYLYISSPGGEVSAGYSIIDQIILTNYPVYTIVTGQAYSIAAIIAAYGEKGHRYINKNSDMMIHSFLLIYEGFETLSNSKLRTDHTNKDYNEKFKQLSKRLNINYNKLKQIAENDYWMNAKESIKLGFVDKIWTINEEKKVRKINAKKIGLIQTEKNN